MKSQLVEAWCMSNEVNLYFLDSISDEYLQDSYAKRTRTVAGQFTHIHNVRLRWLNHSAPKLVDKLESFPKGAQPSRAELKKALKASEEVIAQYLEECEAAGDVKYWSGPPATFLSYLVASRGTSPRACYGSHFGSPDGSCHRKLFTVNGNGARSGI